MTAATAPGDVIGGYRLVAPLGGGGMGAVWLARHTALERTVAMKLLHPALSQDPVMIERFFAEARAATRVADPGIVTVHDFGWHTDGRAFLVMEYLVGETLAERLQRRGRLPVDEAIAIVRLAALAMAAAHAAQIIHRDLKPDNLFLVADPAVRGGERVKVLDFGIAKLVGEGGDPVRTQTGAILGTPMYMSPEQCRSAGGVDHRTDIYALGGVLYHLLTGQPPFPATSAADLIAGHLMEPPPSARALVADVPPAVDAIVTRCLAKAPDQRHASMTELARALDAAAAPDLGFLATLAAGVQPPPPPRRRRAFAIAAAVTALATAAFTIAWRLREREAPSVAATAVDAATLDVAVEATVDAAPADAAVDAIPTDAPTDAPRATRRRYDPYAIR